MKSSVDYLQELIEYAGDEWKKRLDVYLHNAENDNSEEYELIDSFIDEYKENVIKNETAVLKKVEQTINNDLLFNELKQWTDRALGAYYATQALRMLEIKDYETAVKLIDCIYEEAVVRFNPDIDQKYQEFDLNSEEEWVDIVSVLLSLSDFVVKRNLFTDGILETVHRSTRLSKKMCRYITSKINKNYDEIRMKLIMEKLYPLDSET